MKLRTRCTHRVRLTSWVGKRPTVPGRCPGCCSAGRARQLKRDFQQKPSPKAVRPYPLSAAGTLQVECLGTTLRPYSAAPESRSYPLNDGFPPGYVPQLAHLPEGAIIDRFGSEYGRYLAPDGTPFADRALAPESVGGEYNRYMVTGKPLPPGWQVVEGPVQPYYGQTPSPGSLQYMVVGPDGVKVSVKVLVDRGILDEYGPRLGR